MRGHGRGLRPRPMSPPLAQARKDNRAISGQHCPGKDPREPYREMNSQCSMALHDVPTRNPSSRRFSRLREAPGTVAASKNRQEEERSARARCDVMLDGTDTSRRNPHQGRSAMGRALRRGGARKAIKSFMCDVDVGSSRWRPLCRTAKTGGGPEGRRAEAENRIRAIGQFACES